MADSLPLVSIVTPSFNQAKYLRETIESVLAQDYPRVEYLVMDGGSTDGSVEIIRAYESRLAYWQSERDAGQADAINKGWQRARGEILAYLNSDDTYNADTVRTSVTALAQNPAAAFSYGDCAWIDEQSKRIGMMTTTTFTLRELLFHNRVPQPTVFARRAMVERVGWLNPQFHWLMDYDLWLRLALHYPTVHVAGALANFRLHDTSKTGTRYQEFLRDHLQMLEQIFAAPTLPRELRALKPRVHNYAYFETAANCFGLGLNDAGNAVLQEGFTAIENPLAYRQDIVSLFANHLAHVAPLRARDVRAFSTAQERAWLDAVMQNLPPRARALETLRADILAQTQLIHAFQKRGERAWSETRQHLFDAVRLNPSLLRQRGVASLLAQSIAKKMRRAPAPTQSFSEDQP